MLTQEQRDLAFRRVEQYRTRANGAMSPMMLSYSDEISDVERELLEQLAGHHSARGKQHHHHNSGLFARLFGQKGCAGVPWICGERPGR